MSDEKKIRFTAEDNVSSVLSKIKQETQRAGSESLLNAQKQAAYSKEELSFLKQKIDLLTKQAAIEKNLATYETKSAFQSRMSSAKTSEERRDIKKEFSGDSASIKKEFDDARANINNLKSIFSDAAKTFKEKERQDKAQVSSAEQQYQAKKSLWDQELREDKKNVARKIKSSEAGFFGRLAGKKDFEDLSDSEKEKRLYQRSVLQSTTPQKGESMFGALIKTEAIKELFGSLRGSATSATSAHDESTLTPKLFGMIPRVSGTGIGAILSSIPFLGGLGLGAKESGALIGDIAEQGKARELEAREEREVSLFGLKSLTGKSVGSLTNLGFTTAQLADVAKQVAIAGGTSKDLDLRTKGLVSLERSYGLDRGSILDVEKSGRMSKTSSMRQVSELVYALKSAGVIKGEDYSSLGGSLQVQQALLKEQSKVFEKPNSAIATGIVTAFRNMGGGFGDDRLQERLTSMNNALSNPSNDFQKARSLGVLSSMNPNDSYYDLLGKQEKGLSTKGYLGGVLSQLENEYGGGQSFKLALKSQFGFSNEATDILASQFQANRASFANIGGDELSKMTGLSEEKLYSNAESRAASLTSEVTKSAAAIQEAFSTDFVEGMKMSLRENGDKAGDEIVALIKRAFTKEVNHKK